MASSECSREFCNNRGKCLLDHTNEKGFVCECLENFKGPTCLYNLNSCASNPCSKDQICLNNRDTYVCVCIQGISCPNSFGAMSMAPLYRRAPKIKINYQYARVNNNTNYLCKFGTCKNDGICQITSDNNNNQGFVCKCKFGYIGKYCEFVDECLLKADLCSNGGTCKMIGGNVSCECQEDFEPPYCVKPKLKSIYCDVNACQNGGTCIKFNFKNLIGMKCQCQPGYTGIFCETSIFF